MRQFRFIFLLYICFYMLSACTSDDDQNQISQVFQDPDGLDIVIVWSPSGVDLDLILESPENDITDVSATNGPSETVDLNSDYPDGTYTVNVEFFGGAQTTYSLTIQEKNRGNRVLEINGSIGPGSNFQADRGVFTIIKDGTTFEVSN